MWISAQQVGTSTLTAGAAAAVIATSVDTGVVGVNLNTPYDAMSCEAALDFENTSLLTGAVATFKVQKRDDAGSWTDVVTRTVTLRGLVGLLAADRAFLTIYATALYTGANFGIETVRMTASCTGANVNILGGSLRVQFADQKAA